MLTERARAEICVQVGRHARPVAQLAAEFGVGCNTAMTAVVDHGAVLVDDPARTAGVSSLGVDETSFLAAGPGRHTTFAPDWSTCGRLLDIVEGRAGSAVTTWLWARDDSWLAAIHRLALDPTWAADMKSPEEEPLPARVRFVTESNPQNGA